ncbi:helix-turn-helix domain-containing protein [Aquamicrobium terrae]
MTASIARMQRSCPCCGQPMHAGRAPIEALEAAPLTPSERLIVQALARIYPRGTTKAHLVDALYAADPNGGPETASMVIGVHLAHLRKSLLAYGWTIPRCSAGRGAQSRYRLEPLP